MANEVTNDLNQDNRDANNFIFVFPNIFLRNSQVYGVMTRILTEMKALKTEQHKACKPEYVFNGIGGEIISYTAQANDWEPEVLYKKIENNKLPSNLTQNWYGLPIIGYLIGIYKGSIYDTPKDFSQYFEDIVKSYDIQNSKTEHLYAICRNVDSNPIVISTFK
jgi:hypothetical protein